MAAFAAPERCGSGADAELSRVCAGVCGGVCSGECGAVCGGGDAGGTGAGEAGAGVDAFPVALAAAHYELLTPEQRLLVHKLAPERILCQVCGDVSAGYHCGGTHSVGPTTLHSLDLT